MSEYVFDTEPIIAFLYDEPGHQAVADRLDQIDAGDIDGSIAEVTASEVFYLIARVEGAGGKPTADSLRVADRDIRTLERRGLTLRRSDWRLAGEIKAHGGLSLADAYGAALAHERNATLIVGADEDFDDFPVEVAVERIREDSV